ncbi:MAG: hypothetical protein AAF927_10875 [Bacteroidota bacterium]
MSPFMIFLYEWKHFVRTPFKLVAVLLFIFAGGYALHNGASLYERQTEEISKIKQKVADEIQETIDMFDSGKLGPEGRPWVDISDPFWAMWYSPIYHFKTPSPSVVYNIGQAEQYGFYKRVTVMSSTYDADMAEEIANPERLQAGTLDFSFVTLFLLPLLLLVCLYNIKGAEADNGFLPLIYAQAGSKTAWLVARVAFYFTLLALITLGLMLYGSLLTNVFADPTAAFWSIYLLIFLYLLFWGLAYGLALYYGNTSMGNTFAMVGIWILICFFVPAAMHQWVSIKYPANLMTDLIDAQRDETYEIYDLSDSVLQVRLNALMPAIVQSPAYQDSSLRSEASNNSSYVLVNELLKGSVTEIEQSNLAKNKLIQTSYWFNPLTFVQNKLNQLTQTDYHDYQNYRSEIQAKIDTQIEQMVMDVWNRVVVDKTKYLEYQQ